MVADDSDAVSTNDYQAIIDHVIDEVYEKLKKMLDKCQWKFILHLI